MERKRILKRLYGEPPKFDPAQVEDLLRDVESPEPKIKSLETKIVSELDWNVVVTPIIFPDQTYYHIDRAGQWPQELIDQDGKPLVVRDRISYPIQIDGITYFSFRDDTPEGVKWTVVNGDLEEVAASERLIKPYKLNGQLYFVKRTQDNTFVLTDWTHKEVSTPLNDEFVPREMNGVVYLLVRSDTEAPLFEIYSMDGKLAFPHIIAEKDLDTHNGQLVIQAAFEQYTRLFNAQEEVIGEKVYTIFETTNDTAGALYFAAKGLPEKHLFDGPKEIPIPGEGRLVRVYQIGDRPFLIKAIDAEYGIEQHIVCDAEGKRLAGPYDDIWRCFNVKGVPYFRVTDQGRQQLIDEHGTEVSDQPIYPQVTQVGDDLFYQTSGKVHSLSGKEWEFETPLIDTYDINGEPWFIEQRRRTLYHGDSNKKWGPFDLIIPRSEKQALFEVYKDGDTYLLKPGQELIGPIPWAFKEAREIGNRIYVVSGIGGKVLGFENGVEVFNEDSEYTLFTDEEFYWVDVDEDTGEQVVKNGDYKVIGEQWGEILYLMEEDGNLYYFVEEQGSYHLVGPDGITRDVFEEINLRNAVTKINGKIYYVARKLDQNGDRKEFLSSLHEQEIGGLFDHVSLPHESMGRNTLVQNGEDRAIIDITGNLLTGWYKGKTQVYFTEGKPMTVFTEDQKEFISTINGQRYGEDLDVYSIRHPVVIQGELFFVASDYRQARLVNEDGDPVEEIEPFDFVFQVTVQDEDKCVIVGRRNTHLVKETVQIIKSI